MAASIVPASVPRRVTTTKIANEGEIREGQPLPKWALAQKVTLSFLSSLPAALVALPAAYGSAMFSQTVYEPPWNAAIGIGVESCYIGLILFARTKSRKTFVMTALAALLCSVIYNTLHAAEVKGLLANQAWFVEWVLALLHGSPLPLLGFSYFMLLHSSSDEAAPAPAPVTSQVEYQSEEPGLGHSEPDKAHTGVSSVLGLAEEQLIDANEKEDEDENKSEEAAQSSLLRAASLTEDTPSNLLAATAATLPDTTGKESPLAVAKPQTTPSPMDLAGFAGSLARQVQSGKLGVAAFETRVEDWLNEAGRVELTDENWSPATLEELKKLIRQVQKRELKVREFDQKVSELLLRRN